MTGKDWTKSMYYVYFLLLADGNIYKGSTGNLQNRMEDHQQGRVKSTKDKRPAVLVGYEAYILPSDARRRERFLKTTEGRRLLRRQYRDILERKKQQLYEQWGGGRVHRTKTADCPATFITIRK